MDAIDNQSAWFEADAAHMIHLRILGQRGMETVLLDQTAECFTRHPGPIQAMVDPVPVDFDLGDEGYLGWESSNEVLEQLSEERKSSPGEFIAVLSLDPSEHGWRIRADDSDPRTLHGHAFYFVEGCLIPMGIAAAHFFLQGILGALPADGGEDPVDYWHGEMRLASRIWRGRNENLKG